MNFVPKWLNTSPHGNGAVGDAASLNMLFDPECPGLVWDRALPRTVVAWLDGLHADNLPTGRVILRPGAVDQAVQTLCDIANTPAGPERERWVADIAAQATAFADLMDVEYVRMRLAAVSNNACRKFHTDAMIARLVCTYRGTGTQYGFVTRPQEEPRDVFTVPRGASILLRGSLWPEHPASGLRHRSPPIEGTGETRMVLVLDPVLDPSNED